MQKHQHTIQKIHKDSQEKQNEKVKVKTEAFYILQSSIQGLTHMQVIPPLCSVVTT